jgi:hypothetical protein
VFASTSSTPPALIEEKRTASASIPVFIPALQLGAKDNVLSTVTRPPLYAKGDGTDTPAESTISTLVHQYSVRILGSHPFFFAVDYKHPLEGLVSLW